MKWFIFILISLSLTAPQIFVYAAEGSCDDPGMMLQSAASTLHCQDCSFGQNDISDTLVKTEQGPNLQFDSDLISRKPATEEVKNEPVLRVHFVSANIIQPKSILHFNCVLRI